MGTDPGSVKWNQIKTPHFKVIYPNTLDSQALYLANALEYFREPGSASMDVVPNKWPVILHNQTIYSNGMTPYAPKRIEMITTPPQANENSYGQAWMDQLVIHEFRHTSQYTAMNRGLTKGLSYLLGQQVIAGVLGVFVPFWFIEGDAVVTETANSKTGRGRMPAFEMKLRAQFLEKGIYSYDKAYNGSYRDFTADWYELGYLLVGHTRIEYGKETWSRVMWKTGNLPVMLVPFSNTLYKETGFGKSRLYNHITSDLVQEWKMEDHAGSQGYFTPVRELKDKYYTNRTQPAVLANGMIVARRTSIDDIPRLVMIDTSGKERILVSPGYMVDENLSVAGNLVCWVEAVNDPRWTLRSYSVIMIHDLQTGKTRPISHKTRYFSPNLSPDAKKIVVVEADETNHYFLVMLDTVNGAVIKRFPTPNNDYPDHPAWSTDGKQIAVTLTRNEGKCLALADAETGNFEIVLPYSYTEISKPCFYKDNILLTGSYTGKDNIFAFNLTTKKLFQVTSARFGANDAAISPDGKKLYYSNYTSGGYEIVTSGLDEKRWKAWDPAVKPTFKLAEQLATQENFIFNSEEVPDSAYTIKPYRKGLNLFNFHSWAPLSIDIDHMDINPGVTLSSQNLLGTSYTTIGYEYNLNEETGKYLIKYSYTGLYPAFDLETDYGLRRGTHQDTIYYDYDELNLGAWVRLPLNWNVKSWFIGMQPFAGYSYNYSGMNPDMELKFTKDRFHSLNTKFYFYAQSRMSERDLNPRWAQSLDINFRQTLFEADTASSIFTAELSLFFPGIIQHHSFRIYGGFQERITEYYRYSDQILIARGFSGIYASKMFSGSVNYEFPLFYPDWNIGPVIYLKRLKAVLFYDQTLTTDSNHEQNYISTGMDLTVDFHLFRHFAPLEAGLRTIYLPDSKTVRFEFLYSMNLNY